MKLVTKCYIDSDGVIADFTTYVKNNYVGGSAGDTQEEKRAFWKWVQHHNNTVEPFFLSLPKMHDADALIEYCLQTFQHVAILTATGHTPIGVEDQKIEWYRNHYPHLDVITVRKSSDKAQYVGDGSLLIDDRLHSIEPWVASGGIGILHTSTETTIANIETMKNGKLE